MSPHQGMLSCLLVREGGVPQSFSQAHKEGSPQPPPRPALAYLCCQGLSLHSRGEEVGSYFFHDLWALNVEGNEGSPLPLPSQCFPEEVVSTLM